MDGHEGRADPDDPGGDPAHFVGSIVDLGEHMAAGRHQSTESQAGNNGHSNQLVVRIPNFFSRLTGAQHLSDNNTDGVAH